MEAPAQKSLPQVFSVSMKHILKLEVYNWEILYTKFTVTSAGFNLLIVAEQLPLPILRHTGKQEGISKT